MRIALLCLILAGCQYVDTTVHRPDGTTVNIRGWSFGTDTTASYERTGADTYSVDWNKMSRAEILQLLGLLP